MPLVLPGLRSIVEDYEDFLVDLWGVIHDGEQPFPSVLPALGALAARGRRVVFVTNSSRSGSGVTSFLVEQLGIPRHLFHDVVSSGDVTRAALEQRDPAVFAKLPAAPRCFHSGAREIVAWLYELGLDFVDDAAEADLVIATGAYADDAALEAVAKELATAAMRGAPLVCTNPDRIIPSARGSMLGPGIIAEAYAGPTFFYGKPHAPIYAAARALLGAGDASKCIAVGDLLETDIRGARNAGIASVLVTATGGSALATEALDLRYAAGGVAPDMIIERFGW